MLSVITSGSFPRLWRIRVTQIHCGSISRADQGCLQYYTAISGRVRSFNYNSMAGRQLSNQDYSICIRSERNFCGIQYNACPDLENNRSRAFTISGNSNNPVPTMVGGGGGSGAAVPTGSGCISDWLLIGCIRSADRIPPLPNCEDRVCGGTFSAEAGMLAKTVQCKWRGESLYNPSLIFSSLSPCSQRASLSSLLSHRRRRGAQRHRQSRLLPRLCAATVHKWLLNAEWQLYTQFAI